MSWKAMDTEGNLGSWSGVINEEGSWRKGPWTAEEDRLLTEYVGLHGEGRWSSVSRLSGLKRNGKSCRLRWVNYLRPDLKKGHITPHEESIIIELHARWGNRWSTIARNLPGRTDNEIKNYWRTHFKTKSKLSAKNSAKETNRLLKRKQFQQQQEQQRQQHQQQVQSLCHQQQQQQQILQLNQLDIQKIMSLLELEDSNETKSPYNCYVPQMTNNNVYSNTNYEDNIMVYNNMFGVDAPSTTEATESTSSNDEIMWDGILWNLDDYGHGNFDFTKHQPFRASVHNLVAPFC